MTDEARTGKDLESWRVDRSPGTTMWIGGTAYEPSRWQFQLLHQRYGFQGAVDRMDNLITWQDKRRPSQKLLLEWAKQVDFGNISHIPEPFVRAFEKRMDSEVYAIATQTLREGAKAAQQVAKLTKKIAQQIDEGTADEKMVDLVAKLSPLAQHLLQNQGHLTRELMGGKKDAPTVNQQFNFGKVSVKSNRLGKKAAKQVKVLDAESVRLG